MEVRNGCWRTRLLIRIFNGFRGPQPSAIVVFHLVPCNSHDPCLQRAGSSIVIKLLPCSQKDFLDYIVHMVIPGGKARAYVPIEVVSVPGNKLCCRLAILAQYGRDKR